MAKFCINCGAPLEEGMTTCSSCGSKIEILSKEEADKFANNSSNTVYCRRCGKPVSSDAVINLRQMIFSTDGILMMRLYIVTT